MVRAKFTVLEKAESANGFRIQLIPVVSGSEENKEFFKWTPSGSINIGTINAKAAEQFIPGKSYYVDFTPAE